MLGTVRIFQPVHGYYVLRELKTWRAEEWASLKPGSVYNALRSLTRDGFLEEVAIDAEGARPARTTYRLTDDGQSEFVTLVRDALWTVDGSDPGRLMAGLSFMFVLSREEVLASVENRISQIEAHHTQTPFIVATMLEDSGKPRHVREIFELADARLQGEAQWARRLAQRIREGDYTFAGEEWPTKQTATWQRTLP